MSNKFSYATGVRVGNWFEDSKGKELAQHSMSRRPQMEISETKSRYLDRFADLKPSAPALAGTDAVSGALVFAHGPNIIDQSVKHDQYLSTTDAIYTQNLKPHDIADTTRSFDVPPRTELIAARARRAAAGIDSWDPTPLRQSSLPQIERTVKWQAPPQIPTSDLSAPRGVQYTSVNVANTINTAVATAVVQPTKAEFSRVGGFTKTFKTMYGEGCATGGMGLR